jgi:hypothetical protein
MTNVGTYGEMPIDMYLKKQETTCMYENPSMVEDNLRSLLRDYTPDEPFLESDQPRGGTDKYGNERGGYESTQRINLRSGARTLTDPYLPDGTFLDGQFTEKDPRGMALEPNMRKHVEQQYARGKFYKYGDDSDNSIMESGWNPYAAQMQIRNAQNITKNYQKNFETSKDSWHNGGMAPGYQVSVKEKIHDEQEIKDPTHAPNINRIDVTNNLSNDTSIGWRRTTDHRFSVAKYGKKNPSKSFTTEDWYKNRSNAHIDHDQYVSWEDSNVSKATALTMMDLAEQRNLHQFTGLNGINYGTSEQDKNKIRNITQSNLSSMESKKSKESRGYDPHTELNGEQKTLSGKKLLFNSKQNITKTHITPTVAENISNVNKKMSKKNEMDLRESVRESASDNGIYHETQNAKKSNAEFNPSLLWKSSANHTQGTSASVKNYKAAVNKIEEGGKKLERIDKNFMLGESHLGNQRRGKLLTDKNQDINTAMTDNEFGVEVARAHLIGPMGSKKMRKFMTRDIEHNEMNDRS